MKNRTIEQTNESLKMVPYCVIKNPSAPSRIGSATSCIARVPALLSRIWPSSQIENAMNDKDTTKAKKLIKLAVVFETKSEKSNMEPGMHANAPNFNAVNSLLSVRRYH